MPDAAPTSAPRTDTRKLILRTARELILTRSYLGLSFQDLADQVGIRKASLYHHFPSKEALGIAVIADSQERFRRWGEGLSAQPPAQRLQAYVQMCRDLIGAGARVCPIGATGSEWSCLEPALQDAVRQFHCTQLDWLAQAALQLRTTPNARPTPEDQAAARQWAAQINALCLGALITARVHDEPGMFDTAVAPLTSSLSLAH